MTVKLVIDTNSYSGNFERELCAFITGHVGECGVGESYADMYKLEHTPLPHVEHVLDAEYGIERPVNIYPTIGMWNDGMGNHYPDSVAGDKKYPAYQSIVIYFQKVPNQALIDFMMERAKIFSVIYGEGLEVLSYRMM